MTNEEQCEEIKRLATLLHQEAIQEAMTTPLGVDSTAYQALREIGKLVNGFVENADQFRVAYDLDLDERERQKRADFEKAGFTWNKGRLMDTQQEEACSSTKNRGLGGPG